MKPVFLTAEWRRLLFLNYEVDPSILKSRVPAGCELDLWNGRCYVSMVGFRFLKTRLLRVPIPFHTNFDEVNLRFYVVREVDGQRRRGVAFVKEIVPRWAIATVARALYGEKYASLPMRHQFTPVGDGEQLTFEWQRDGRWERLAGKAAGPKQMATAGSEQEFITEHYWGYAPQRPRSDGRSRTMEYQVEHPRWTLQTVSDPEFECDVASLYGEEFAEPLRRPPSTAFVASGSPVAIRWGGLLPSETT